MNPNEDSEAYWRQENFCLRLRTSSKDEIEAAPWKPPRFAQGSDEYGITWVFAAISSGNPDAVGYMLSAGVDLHVVGELQSGVLHEALKIEAPASRLAILRLLLEAGAPVNATGIDDDTPAHVAVHHRDLASLRLLVQYGADLDAQNHDFQTPATLAEMNAGPAMSRFIRDRRPT